MKRGNGRSRLPALLPRHADAGRHPCLSVLEQRKAWVPTCTGMTIGMSLLAAVIATSAMAQLTPPNPGAHATPSLGTVWVPDTPAPVALHKRTSDQPRPPGVWMIDDGQWDRFQAAIAASGVTLRVTVRLNTLRARVFKEDLVDLLTSLPGWTVEDQGTYTAGTLESFDGILIQNASALNPTPEAAALKAALDAAGIRPEAVYDATQPDQVRIVIGAPPGG